MPGNPYNLVNSEELASLTKQANPSTILFKNGLPDYIYAGPGISGTAMEGDPAVDPSKYRFDAGNPASNYIIQKVNKNGTNWFQETFDPAPITSHNISASGATDKANYLFSLEYFNQKGTMKGTFMERYSARINTSYNINKKIRVGQNVYIFYRTNAGGDRGLGDISGLLPVIPVYDIKGNFGGAFAGPELGGGHNPVATQEFMRNDRRNMWSIIGNAFAEVDILKNLTVRTSIGGNIDNRYNSTFNFNKYYSRQENTGPNRLSESALYNSNYIWTNTLTYSGISGDHSLKFLLGSEALKNSGREVGGSANNFFSSEFDYLILGNGTSNVTNYSSAYVNTLFSIFSRIDYSLRDKYILALTIRRDGSSRFGSENRYGVFPSISAGWQISSEAFMKNITFVNDLKLRASYGVLGSQNNVNASNGFTLYGGGVGNAYYDINGTSNRIQQGFIQTTNGNLQTGWEKNIVSNIGLDMTLFNNSTSVSIEYYKKFINGLLFPQPLPATAGGAQPPIINIGNIQNTGVDFSAGYRGSISKGLKYNIGINVTTYKNLVVEIPDPGYFDTDRIRNQEGHPVSSFFGYDVVGLFKNLEDVTSSPTQIGAAPGRFKYRDVDENGVITPNDRTFLGSPNPDFTYGTNVGLGYKGFDLSAIFYGSQGNEVLNMPRRDLEFFGSLGSTKSRVLLDAWTPENTNSSIPKIEAASSFSTNGANNSYLMENGSYLRLRSLILGYNVNKYLTSKLNIGSARLYLQATNLFTLTKYTGLDPEIAGTSASFGLDYNYYPNNEKNFIFGINLSF